MNPEQWLSLKWNGGSTMSDRWLNQSKIIHQDAVPMRLGQSFGAFAHVLKRDIKRLKNVMDEMKVLNIGATAIGTAINVDPYYLANISYELSKVAGISLKQADDSSKTEWFIHHARKDQPSDSRSCITGCIPDHWT